MSLFNVFQTAKAPSEPLADAVTFSSAGLYAQPSSDEVRRWVTDDGDGVGLYLFRIPPDIPRVSTFGELRKFYQSNVDAGNGRLVEFSLVVAANCRAIRMIVKIPQQPAGMLYVGSITIPFAAFSFVVKVQCSEARMTGIREAIIADRLLSANETSEKDIVSLVDDEKFDTEFPDHPLSRLRRRLTLIENSLAFREKIVQAPRFPLPAA